MMRSRYSKGKPKGRRTMYAGNWSRALRLVPGITKVAKVPEPAPGPEVPEEPVQLQSGSSRELRVARVHTDTARRTCA